MREVWAFIKNLTPLTQGNDKSCVNIVYELIPNITNFKNEQDSLLNDINKQRDTFNKDKETFNNKLKENVDNINSSVNTNKENFINRKNLYLEKLPTLFTTQEKTMSDFSEKLTSDINSFKNTIENDKTNLINGIDNRYNDIIAKINDYLSDYFVKNPDVFTSGIEKVNFNKEIKNTSTNKWETSLNSRKYIYPLKGDTQVKGYWYNKEAKMIYNGDHVTTDYKLNNAGQLYSYDNHLLFTDLEFTLGEELFPHTENGYFIGFIKRVAYYFAEANEASGTTYNLKAINLDTKEIITYENLVMPTGFKSVYLQNNSHYVINKCNDIYYILYSIEGEFRPYLAKSSDLIHWANIGRIDSSGESALKVINNNLYYVSLINGSWIFNETENNLTKILDNGKNVIVNGEYLGLYSAFTYNDYNKIFCDDKNFTNVIHKKSSNIPTGLAHAILPYSSTDGYIGVFLGTTFYTDSTFGDFYLIEEINTRNVYLRDQLNHKHLLLLDYEFSFDKNIQNTFRNMPTTFPLNINQYGDFVITDDMEVYSDFNLQKLSCKVETRSINT